MTCTQNLKLPKVEVVEVYKEKQPSKIWATFHVFLPDFNLDLRGGVILKKKDKFWILMPTAVGYDADTDKKIRFPVVSSPDRNFELGLRKAVQQAVLKYLQKKEGPKKRTF